MFAHLVRCGTCVVLIPIAIACSDTDSGNNSDSEGAGDVADATVMLDGAVFDAAPDSIATNDIAPDDIAADDVDPNDVDPDDAAISDTMVDDTTTDDTTADDATGDVMEEECVAPMPAPSLGCLQGLAAGTDHTCAINSGGVWCWGVNGANGVLGYGNILDVTVTTPVQVVNLTDVTQIVAASNSTCALKSDRTVWCWGIGGMGQMGNNTTTEPNPTPVQVVGVDGVGVLSDIIEITAKSAGGHFCARACDGTSYCWGSNTFGQASDGTRGNNRLAPVQTLFPTARSISAGTQNTCIQTMSGSFMCSGFNGEGQLGNGQMGLETGTPQDVSNIMGEQVAVGNLDICAIVTDGTVACWGANNQGQHGNDNMGISSNTPTPTDSSLVDVAHISASDHMCAFSSTGALSCWGRNNRGQVGNGTTTPVAIPQPIAVGASPVDLVATSRNHTCVGLTDERVWCWGKNQFGQLGRGTAGANEPSPAEAIAFTCP